MIHEEQPKDSFADWWRLAKQSDVLIDEGQQTNWCSDWWQPAQHWCVDLCRSAKQTDVLIDDDQQNTNVLIGDFN